MSFLSRKYVKNHLEDEISSLRFCDVIIIIILMLFLQTISDDTESLWKCQQLNEVLGRQRLPRKKHYVKKLTFFLKY